MNHVKLIDLAANGGLGRKAGRGEERVAYMFFLVMREEGRMGLKWASNW